MCGIYYEICTKNCKGFALEKDKILKQSLESRGPDFQEQLLYKHDCLNLISLFYCSVLWMQGDILEKQPLENEHGVLIYNGDNFDKSLTLDTSDTKYLFRKLCESCKSIDILKIIRSLKGPFSLVYLNKTDNIVYFSRDKLGRNSLLCYLKDSGIIISSVLNRSYKNTIEVPTTYIYAYNLANNMVTSHPCNEDDNEYTLAIKTWYSNILNEQLKADESMQLKSIDQIFIDEKSLQFINFVETTCKTSESKQNAFQRLLQNNDIKEIVDKLILLLKKSVKIRIKRQPQLCQECLKLREQKCNHCTVSVLFSGGLDCTILALIADDYVPIDQQIDLLNVAFDLHGNLFEVPDRLTGRVAFEELKKLRPDRNWSFKEINVDIKELQSAQNEIIADLVYPRRTILDESLGSALWFAARGTCSGTGSTSRVVLVGSGADELFGGYTRHRNTLKRKSWQGLHEELLLDWARLPHRNLARDNRVISHHGRQPRMPYLDEDFADFVNGLKPWERCIPSESCGAGLGEKLFLRLVAYELGLKDNVSAFPKRAIQFGSRIANKKENGADISLRFINKLDIS